jgi:alpha-tubulin suppressor-like RCC1 family protein
MKKIILTFVAVIFVAMPLLAQPTITQPPTNQVLALGDTLNLSVAATGNPPLSYQWLKDSRWLLGATNSTLTVANAGVTNSGTYSIIVTNGDGMLIGMPILVAVGNPTLAAWGYNVSGGLDTGTSNNWSVPVTVATNVAAAAGGWSHTLFITAGGGLWAVGGGSFGQLGISTNIYSDPIVTNVASNVVGVAAGDSHSLFITADGTLWGMGNNGNGQLGLGALSSTNRPASVASNVVAVVAGAYHSLFLKRDGTLWTMGNNWHGQLGNGNWYNSSAPVNVASNVFAMAGGTFHSLFAKTDGTLWAMGNNGSGQLGNGMTSDINRPVGVASNVVAVAAGGAHSMFLTSDGTLWAMGYNGYGQLGNGTTSDTNLPISVASNVVAMAGGQDHTLFVTADGLSRAMGYNTYGQLGDGMTQDTHAPTNVLNLTAANVCPLDAGHYSLAIGVSSVANVILGSLNQTYTGKAISVTVSTVPAGLTVNLTYNGSSSPPTNTGSYTVIGTISDPIYSGNATNKLVISNAPPVITVGPTNQILVVGETLTLSATAISAPIPAFQWFKDGRLLVGGTNSTLAVTNAAGANSGTYYVLVTNSLGMAISLPALVTVGNPLLLAWGDDWYGELGNGIGFISNNNMPITIATNVVAGAAGAYHSLFITSDGTLWAMGENNYGQLGNGTSSGVAPNPTPANVSSNVVAVAAGNYHSLFITSDGRLWAMGYNTYGQLGNRTTSNTNLPVNVASNVVAVAAGSSDSFFVTSDGRLWAMGYNYYGQLGIGASDNNAHFTPLNVSSNVVAVAAGQYHLLFMKRDGTLWAMGENNSGQLGNGTWNNSTQPINVAHNVVAMAAGANHSLFVTNNGTLWAVGFNNDGELGNGTWNTVNRPVNVASNVVSVAAGYYHSLFTQTNGTLWAMGGNNYGQLGNGMTSSSNRPANLPHLSIANVFPADTAFHSLAIGILQTPATVTLANLNQLYSGSAINVTASTTPPGLTVNLTYNGSSFAPTNAGSYTVIGTISDPNYYGSATNTLVVGLPPQSFTASNTSGTNGQQLTLQLIGTPTYPYVLQTATNLTPPINWQSILTNSADAGGNWSFIVTNLTDAPGRFYRAVGQ